MAGVHADRGDRSHRITTGERPEIGMRVMDNDMEWGVIVELADTSDQETCGWYCDAWVTVEYPNGRRHVVNCERMASRDLITGRS